MLALLIGALGLGGFGAAAFFFPALLPAAISLVGVVLRCKPCLFVLALLVAYLVGDIRATQRERADCKAADIAMQLRAAQRDAKAQADAAAFAANQVRELSDQVADLNQKVADAKNIPHVACPLGDRADKLRAIAPR